MPEKRKQLTLGQPVVKDKNGKGQEVSENGQGQEVSENKHGQRDRLQPRIRNGN